MLPSRYVSGGGGAFLLYVCVVLLLCMGRGWGEYECLWVNGYVCGDVDDDVTVCEKEKRGGGGRGELCVSGWVSK